MRRRGAVEQDERAVVTVLGEPGAVVKGEVADDEAVGDAALRAALVVSAVRPVATVQAADRRLLGQS